LELLPATVEAGAEGDTVRLSTGLMQFVAADDVAAIVAELATGAPAGGRVEIGGPETLGLDAWAQRLFAATGDPRTVVAHPHARYFGTELHGGELTTGSSATACAKWRLRFSAKRSELHLRRATAGPSTTGRRSSIRIKLG
jgi:uncharacterized protein YbjT (DUF2867 family)